MSERRQCDINRDNCHDILGAKTMITYQYATTKTEANRAALAARAAGRRAYVLTLRAGHYEIRIW
jgi:hypothetical protein